MNMQEMMRQAQALQNKMQTIQEELKSAEIEGSAGGGLVKVKVTGKGEAKGIEIDASLLAAEEKEMLEDLVIAAFNNAKENADKYLADKMNSAGIPSNLAENMF